MREIIRNSWRRVTGTAVEEARILSKDTDPEGLDIRRFRFLESGQLPSIKGAGNILSVLKGSGHLILGDDREHTLRMAEGFHAYLPPESGPVVHAEKGTQLLVVSAGAPEQVRGKRLLVRDEEFIRASARGDRSLRWTLTSQYLSRRIFLHHDQTLLSSPQGTPVSWFRTTMFDVGGLPPNEDGLPVFKMSYNYQTEVNVCYDVAGIARVRMAAHPYSDHGQTWGPWQTLDHDSTYHLNEAVGGPEEERRPDPTTGALRALRNKHEVHISDGHVSLFCLFDPAPTGAEQHQPGAYSDYGRFSDVVGTAEYKERLAVLNELDEMVDTLSLAKAQGRLDQVRDSPMWKRYLDGRRAQDELEKRLLDKLVADGQGREEVLGPWTGHRDH